MKSVAIVLLILVNYVVAQDTENTSELGATKIRDIDGMIMVYVPAGKFEMGSSDEQLDKAMEECRRVNRDAKDCQRHFYSKEQPNHQVILDAFWIDRTEVTNAQYCKFLNENGNHNEEGVYWFEPGAGHREIVYGYIDEIDGVFIPKAGYENYPVIEVSWYGAEAYCNWIEGRLPTEAEWEYAARGPASYIYPWGDEFIGSFVNYRNSSFTFDDHGKDTSFNDGFAKWAPVGSYPNGASWCGVLDMSGNVHEWVADRWSPNYYALSPTKNPKGPNTGTLRIGRGGSWYDPSWHVRSSYRKALRPSSGRMHWIGFRCVIPIE